MKHRVATKRVLAARIRTALAALSVDPGDVLDMIESNEARSEVVILRVLNGSYEIPAQNAPNVINRIDTFEISIGVAVSMVAQDGREAEDRCAAITEAIDRVLADRNGIFRAVIESNPLQSTPARMWSFKALELQSSEGPEPVEFGDQGASSYASMTCVFQVAVGVC